MARAIRRIFGLETEFGLAVTGGQMTPEHAARLLFRPVVAWGRSTNVYLRNGSRLYLDVGSHPEYATAECDSIRQTIAYDQAGVLLLRDMVDQAHRYLDQLEHNQAPDGVNVSAGVDADADAGAGLASIGSQATASAQAPTRLHVMKNNVDSAGNTYGCHENYMLARSVDLGRAIACLVPFLVTRQLVVGAGHVMRRPAGAVYTLSQRAEHLWADVSTATTRDRPLINARDEPHADAEKYRRLHVIAGDSSMSQRTSLVKLACMDLVLACIEAGLFGPKRRAGAGRAGTGRTTVGQASACFSLDNTARAIRAVNLDVTGRSPLQLADGGTATALDIQWAYLDMVTTFAQDNLDLTDEHTQALDLWERALLAVETGCFGCVDRDLDWVIKKKLIDRFCQRQGVDLDDYGASRLGMAYHDVSAQGLYFRLEAKGLVNTVVSPQEVCAAMDRPPASTRAKLRGDFVRAASAARRDYSVDWTHLKTADPGGVTCTLLDPFDACDEQALRLIDSLARP